MHFPDDPSVDEPAGEHDEPAEQVEPVQPGPTGPELTERYLNPPIPPAPDRFLDAEVPEGEPTAAEAESPIFPPLPPRPDPTERISPQGPAPVLPPNPLRRQSDVARPPWSERAERPGLSPSAPSYETGPAYPRPGAATYEQPVRPILPSDEATMAAAHRDARPRRRWPTAVLSLLSGLVGAALALAVFVAIDDEPTVITQAEPAPVTTAADVAPAIQPSQVITPPEFATDAVAVAEKVTPSIVRVDVLADGSPSPIGSGSGVVLTEDGLIVTNQHVIDDADSVEVVFASGRVYVAEVIGADALTDLAVLRISATGLIPIEIGSTDALDIGDVAIAAGSPLGLTGGPTVTVGVVSAFNRRVQTGPDPQADVLYGLLQTDAPITRGSSGGALVDSQGRLIGITSAVGVSDVGVEGIGFAIPIELMLRITDELIDRGQVAHAFLGISGATSFVDEADGARFPEGVLIDSVEPNSGASEAGLQAGDVILSIDGESLTTFEALVAELRGLRVGQTVDLAVDRDGELLDLKLTLGERPENL